MSLLQLQDEILLRCLAGAGCHGLCAAAVTCRRLAELKVRNPFMNTMFMKCDLCWRGGRGSSCQLTQ